MSADLFSSLSLNSPAMAAGRFFFFALKPGYLMPPTSAEICFINSAISGSMSADLFSSLNSPAMAAGRFFLFTLKPGYLLPLTSAEICFINSAISGSMSADLFSSLS